MSKSAPEVPLKYDEESEAIQELLVDARKYHRTHRGDRDETTIAKANRNYLKQNSEEIRRGLLEEDMSYPKTKQVFDSQDLQEMRHLGRALRYISDTGILDTYSETNAATRWNLVSLEEDPDAFRIKYNALVDEQNEDYFLE